MSDGLRMTRSERIEIFSRVVFVTLIATILIALFVYSINGRFSRFVADDYCYAAKVNQLGLWGAQLSWYINWTGRFAATFLNSIVLLGGPWIHGYLVIGFIVLWVAAASKLGHQVAKQLGLRDSLLAGALLALTAVLFWLGTMTRFDNAQTLYWITGAVTYTVPLVFATIYACLGLYVWNHPRTTRSRSSWFLMVGILALVAGGFSEGYLATQIGTHIVLFGLIIIYSKREMLSRRLLFAGSGLIGSLAALAIMAFAPGNSVRKAVIVAQSASSPDILKAPVVLLRSMVGFLSDLIQAVPIPVIWMVIAVPMSIAILCHPLANKTDDGFRVVARALVVVPVSSLIIIYFALAPAAYVFGSSPPARSLTAAILISGLGLMVWSYVAGIAIRPEKTRALSVARTGSLAALLASIVVPLWLANDAYGQSERWMAFASAWDRRHSAIVEASNAGKRSIVTVSLDNDFGLNDLRDDPKYWVNSCMARYYGIDSVTARSVVD